jgi:hypothetical protein
MSRNALRSCLRSSSLRHSRVRFLSKFLSNSSIASISSRDVGAPRFTCTATACTNASRAPGYSAKRASSSLVCTVFGTMTFLAKPSIGKSAALKIWQCASMIRSIGRADAGWADVHAGNAAAPIASAAPPATNSRRRMLTSSNAPARMLSGSAVLSSSAGGRWDGAKTNQYAYSLNTGSTLRCQLPLNFCKSSSAGVMPRAT